MRCIEAEEKRKIRPKKAKDKLGKRKTKFTATQGVAAYLGCFYYSIGEKVPFLTKACPLGEECTFFLWVRDLSVQAMRTPTISRESIRRKIPIFEALGQILANHVFSPIRIEIRVIRVDWEPVDPVVADPVRQDNEKRNNMQIYTEIPY